MRCHDRNNKLTAFKIRIVSEVSSICAYPMLPGRTGQKPSQRKQESKRKFLSDIFRIKMILLSVGRTKSRFALMNFGWFWLNFSLAKKRKKELMIEKKRANEIRELNNNTCIARFGLCLLNWCSTKMREKKRQKRRKERRKNGILRRRVRETFYVDSCKFDENFRCLIFFFLASPLSFT